MRIFTFPKTISKLEYNLTLERFIDGILDVHDYDITNMNFEEIYQYLNENI